MKKAEQPPAEPAPAAPASALVEELTRKPRRRPFDALRENLEAVAVAVVLALIIRHFSVEAFEIPTGSMAPTLYGIHSWVECPNCDTEFNIGLQSDSATGQVIVPYTRKAVPVYWGACPRPGCKLPYHRAAIDGREPIRPGQRLVCPNDQTAWTAEAADFSDWRVITADALERILCPICWFRFHEVVTSWNQTGGHKILVTKFAFKVSKPRRWDVIVFQFDRETNYIKRLIGLPGEKVLLRGGDVYVDGKIERKHARPEVQEVLWTKVGDTGVRERGYQRLAAWKEAFPQSRAVPAGSWKWNESALQWSVNSSADGRPAVLRYQRPLVNYYHYNLLAPDRGQRQEDPQVGDKKVAFTLRTPRGARGWVGGEIRDGDFTFQARIPLGSPDPARPATLRMLPPDPEPERPAPDRAPLAEAAGGRSASAVAAVGPDAVARIEFENVDDRVAVRLDGKEILVLEYQSGSKVPRNAAENALLLLAGDGAGCVLESIQVYRDIHYTESGDHAVGNHELALRADDREKQYFPCGDNSPSSADGRYWHSVPEGNLMGRALLVFWPLWPGINWQFKMIR